ncbi:four-carbon acid sugar kinase family protein [Streptomyces sp. B6B3]|uniref:four-carbon acid sugar kinase family protein n=1 Tax=Streptomyces sp. B6B3 TaxID=3153570 RepID=UPI00325DDC0A
MSGAREKPEQPGKPEKPEKPEKVVVLDDDPTGTQSAHDVDILFGEIDTVDAGLAAFAADDRRAVYVLTNTRASTPDETARLVGELRRSVRTRIGDRALVVLRGDSTLRGHVALEMNLLGLADGVGIVVPAFPAGGRVTRGGVHLVRTAAGEVPVAETEYARDPVFGYTHSRLDDWAREVGLGGRPVTLGLDEIRATGAGAGGGAGASAVASALLHAPPGSVVLPDAVSDDDIATIAAGIGAARRAGRRVVVRAAAPLAAALAGTSPRIVAPPAARAVLVACGSHTEGASRQLARLPVPARLLPDAERLLGAGPDDGHRTAAELDALAGRLRADLATRGLAVVATPRRRSAAHGDLHHGAVVMDALVRVVAAAAPAADCVVSKGGITGADIATRALGSAAARVLGQVVTGVPLWRLDRRGPGAHHQVVVPGNVGDDRVLLDIVESLRGRGRGRENGNGNGNGGGGS